jgi:hypothetical protein
MPGKTLLTGKVQLLHMPNAAQCTSCPHFLGQCALFAIVAEAASGKCGDGTVLSVGSGIAFVIGWFTADVFCFLPSSWFVLNATKALCELTELLTCASVRVTHACLCGHVATAHTTSAAFIGLHFLFSS